MMMMMMMTMTMIYSDDDGDDDVPLVITRWAMPGMPPSLISPSILQSQIYCCSQEIYNTHTLSIVLHPDVTFERCNIAMH